jgi:hypothetical protein
LIDQEEIHNQCFSKDSKKRMRALDKLKYISYMPDKQQAWNNSHKLANDTDIYVRIYAQYSLEKVFIFKASQSENEEDYKKELENAIEFFEKISFGMQILGHQ